MSELNDLCRLFVCKNFHPTSGPWATAFIDFDAETSTTTQCAVWTTTDPAGARAALGNRQFRTLGPVISYANHASIPNAAVALDSARSRAIRGLLDQLIATLPAGVAYPYPALAG